MAYFHHYDGQGNTLCLTDDTQTRVVERFTYTAFGERLDVLGDPTLTPFQWNGRWGYYYDEDLGEYHVRARPYEPATARWLTVDPRWIPSDWTSLYCYAGNQPTRRLDPSGQFPLPDRVCPPGHSTCQRPGYELTPDGCSVPDWAVSLFGILDKDRPKGGALFKYACFSHDYCWHDCFKTRKECDDRFLQDLLAACSAAANDPELQAPEFTTAQCELLARIYHAAVAEPAANPELADIYNDDQAKACCCCSPCVPTTCIEPINAA